MVRGGGWSSGKAGHRQGSEDPRHATGAAKALRGWESAKRALRQTACEAGTWAGAQRPSSVRRYPSWCGTPQMPVLATNACPWARVSHFTPARAHTGGRGRGVEADVRLEELLRADPVVVVGHLRREAHRPRRKGASGVARRKLPWLSRGGGARSPVVEAGATGTGRSKRPERVRCPIKEGAPALGSGQRRPSKVCALRGLQLLLAQACSLPACLWVHA